MTSVPHGKPELLGGVVDAELLRYWRTFAKPSNEVLACDLIEALLHKLSALESVRSEARNAALEEAARRCETRLDRQRVGDQRYRDGMACAAAIRALQSPARVAEGVIARLKSRVADAAKAWLIRYEDEVRDEAEEAPCKNLVAAVDALVAAEVIAAGVAEGETVPEGESRWLIERTYAKGQPAERREFWLGTTPNDMFHDSFNSNNEVWTTNALEAARFSSQKIAETLRYRHFHPEAPVEACGHMFQCGISPEVPIREDVHSTELRK